ncbi:Thermostable carboxypeptidase 1 [Cardinium endosymbiont cEper1 of Encarsia pergandiella]|uniref:carboxypeptidase M32 n=1 Tax=Cardinium endosymbiont of Encarsia pergandiella TaxID=249402 RepID=UPI00027EA05F|nr:carboxypeptidase M32 [Cardinium endosymbiont of Encarsia pergandiella]CCM10125.1 Thermostable carboxypeptidase 1 [Cardinium endosymbiont cEper1 of Encarsia pergandiella]
MSTYESFVERFSHIQLLRQTKRLLSWDQQTYMPAGAVDIRAKQLAYLASLAHGEATSSKYRDALAEMIDIDTEEIKLEGLSKIEASNLKQWCKDFKGTTKLPQSFVQAYYATTTTATEVWKKARATSDFDLFRPWLQKVVNLNREKANLLGYVDSPYDALIDLYEPGITSSTLSTLFEDLSSFLSAIVKKTDGKDSPYKVCFDHCFHQEAQMRFNHLLLKTIGISGENTRLDCSAHPFCSGIHPSDVRITTNLAGGLLQNIFAVLHESGHALYELGLSKEGWATPYGQSVSMGVHESQSRWWEVMVGQSLPFWSYMYPIFQKHFLHFNELSLADFYQHINHVQTSFIRIYADEVTYPLHIILRFELEKALIEGTMDVSDVPEMWNVKMQALLGITPKNDAEGCLQDIHWSSGYFGYFPTYALGNIYAVQYFAAFVQSFPDWDLKVREGSFSFMKDWLYDHIHQFGRMYNPMEIMQRVTGHPISTQPYKDYIRRKYQNLSK